MVMTMSNPRALLAANRRPAILTVISFVLLAVHHVLVRAMAHGHVAHVLLGAGNAPPPVGAATLAIGLVVVRLLTVLLVPGFLLAAAAELVAYFLVGPKRGDDLDDDLSEPLAEDAGS